jgi:hypothetical protein
MPGRSRRIASSAGRSASIAEPRARAVDFSDEELILRLEDGRTLLVPLAWLPRLKNATDTQRRAYELLDGGEALRWEELDRTSRCPACSACPTETFFSA